MGKLFGKKGLFFWMKKKSDAENAEDMVQLYLKYMPQLKKIMNEGQQVPSDGKIIGQMYDYYKDYNGTLQMTPMEFDVIAIGPNDTMAGGGEPQKKGDERIVATPVSVMNELETVPNPFTIENLDEKIETLKDKTKLLNQRYAKAQIEGLCKRLENRKKYRDNVEFYSSFPNTADDKIDTLLKKYKLEIGETDLFIPTFPKEAIDIMKKYSEVTKKISGETPVYYVIAEPKDFKKKREKLDPILLAQSPFGFFWQVLGAWDKEMLLLSEL